MADGIHHNLDINDSMSAVIEWLSHFLAATIQSGWWGRQERYRRRGIRGRKRERLMGREETNLRYEEEEIGASEEDETRREGNKEGEWSVG